MAGVVYIEVRGDMDEFAVFQEVYGPRGIASRTVIDLANYCLAHALKNSPIGNALNYGSGVPAPRFPGQYVASWSRDRRGSNVGSYQMRVSNLADHASIVEWGRNYTRAGQAFTWTKARTGYWKHSGNLLYQFVDKGPKPGGWVFTSQTGPIFGKHVLANAQRAAAARYGLATT